MSEYSNFFIDAIIIYKQEKYNYNLKIWRIFLFDFKITTVVFEGNTHFFYDTKMKMFVIKKIKHKNKHAPHHIHQGDYQKKLRFYINWKRKTKPPKKLLDPSSGFLPIRPIKIKLNLNASHTVKQHTKF